MEEAVQLVERPLKKRTPRRDFDYYPTPTEFISAGLDLVTGTPRTILDPGSGDGLWGTAARRRWPKAAIMGVEVQSRFKNPGTYDQWLQEDFSVSRPFSSGDFDLVCGNPPYCDAEVWVRKCLGLLGFGGQLIFLLRLAFLESQVRSNGLFREFPPELVAVCARRPTFYGYTTGMTAFAYYCWRNGHQRSTELRWSMLTDIDFSQGVLL